MCDSIMLSKAGNDSAGQSMSPISAVKKQKKPYIKPEIQPCKSGYVKSPLNYIGGKYKILNQIMPLFPNKIKCFVDLFAGGCNVGINATAEKIMFNDNLVYLMELYTELQRNSIGRTLEHIQNQINAFELSKENESGYKKLRTYYNNTKNPLDLLVLVSYSFNHQIRFNNSHEFNNPFGKNRSSYNSNIERNLINFIKILKAKKTSFSTNSFEEFDFKPLSSEDFVYCDPPYLITTGTYNDGKRGFKGWADIEELKLLDILDRLSAKGVNFALSNVIKHKGKENHILKDWLQNNKGYRINYIDKNYANSNYQTIDKGKDSSTEVLITNYTPTHRPGANLQLVPNHI